MKRHFWMAAALILLAFALRLRDIDRYDLWYDEIGQVNVASRVTLSEILQGARKHHAASPLSYLGTALAMRLGGRSELALRFEPLIWSVLAAALTMRAARALAPGSGLWAGLLAAVSPFAIRYAQEVRFYALGLMWASAVFCLVTLAAKNEIRTNLRTWLALGGAMTALLYSHVYSAFIVAPTLMMSLLLARPGDRLKLALWQASAYAVAGALFIPWLLNGLTVRAHPFGSHVFTSHAQRAVAAGLELTPIVLPSVGHEVEGGFASAMVALSVLSLAVAAIHVRRRPWLLAGMLGVALATLAVCAANLVVGYFFAPRQFLFLQPVRFALIGATLTELGRSAQRVLYPLAVAGLTALSLVYTHADLHRNERESWRPLTRAIAAQGAAPGALAFAVPYWTHTSPAYYLRLAGVEVVWQRPPGDRPTAADFQNAPSGSLVFISYADADLLPLLRDAGFREVVPPPGAPAAPMRALIKDGP
ncbi:MAG: hypothetical protein ACK4JD_12900 [Thermoflexales bacterium]